MNHRYTGVGSRSTPPDVLHVMRRIADRLHQSGYVLRSGHAEGADMAFEQMARGKAEIYLPWPGFNSAQNWRRTSPAPEAYKIAMEVHPAWARCGSGPRALHARNCHQVLGNDLNDPSDFLVCWTPDGCTGASSRTSQTGGTATAIVLAEKYGVPVFNLKNPGSLDALARRLAGRA